MRKILVSLIIFSNAIVWAGDSKDKPVIIDAYNFKIGIAVPGGWKGVPQTIKTDYILYMLYNLQSSPMNPGPVITIQTFPKTGVDMEEYIWGKIYNILQKQKDMEVEDFDFLHPKYDSFSIAMYTWQGASSYMTAIDPGVQVRKGILIFMTVPGREATDEELEVFMKIAGSIELKETH